MLKVVKKHEEWTFNRILVTAFLIRLIFVFYSRIHDYIFEVSFTDIDYRVFSDAAKLVSEGRSPFDRPTYRYTPIFAWILLPTVVFQDFGKFLFSLVDCVTGWLLYQIVLQDDSTPIMKSKDVHIVDKKNYSENSITQIALCWLLNPFIAIISTRGSTDSLVCCAVLLSLFLLKRRNNIILCGIVHGAIAIHLKIYPIIYLPSAFLYLCMDQHINNRIGFSLAELKNILRKSFDSFAFVSVTIISFCFTVVVCYLFYGKIFLNEFLLYHMTRKDVRHNFSPYFYPLYLTMDDPSVSQMLSLCSFIPQILLILLFAIKYYVDLPFCWFLTTLSFVSFNKICTSQYFVWYLCFLPLICNRINISVQKALCLFTLWLAAQGIWLLFAYLFEFCGSETLPLVWISSMCFLATNCYIIVVCIKNHSL